MDRQIEGIELKYSLSLGRPVQFPLASIAPGGWVE